ncbi:MAG: SDR family NAD(P)-dependent oxidoreductase, partial [Bacteroidia bacterium]
MPTPFHLHHKTVLITGASSGIGRQAAIDASKMGAAIMLVGRDEARLKETLAQLEGSSHKHFVCDLTDAAAIQQLAAELPALDGIVHCAGIVKPFPVMFIDEKRIAETLKINLHSPMLIMTALTAKKKISKNCSVVFISSVSSLYPHAGGALYSISKAGIEAYSRSLALEYVSKGLRSNCIAPALIKTPMYEFAEKSMTSMDMDEHIKENYPLGLGLPEDVSNMIVFLLSEASRWITGKKFDM